MWTPLDVPIEVSRNGVTGIGLEIWDDVANVPMDLTGMEFTCKVARNLGGIVLASFNVEVTSAIAGQLDVNFDGRAIDIEGMQEIVRLVYEIKNNNGDTALRGPIYLIPGI